MYNIQDLHAKTGYMYLTVLKNEKAPASESGRYNFSLTRYNFSVILLRLG